MARVLGAVLLVTPGCHLILPLGDRVDDQEDAGPRDAGLERANPVESGVSEAGVTGVTHYWSRSFQGKGNDVGKDVAVDGNNNVYVVGTFQNEADFGGGPVSAQGTVDTFLVSYSPTGAYRWARDLGGSSTTYGESVAVDGAGNVYVTGRFGGTADFGGGTQTSPAGSAVFLVSYTSDGVYRWAQKMGGSSLDKGNAVTVDSTGNVTVTGGFGGTADFVGTTLTGAGSTDIFLASFTSAGTYRWAKSFGSMWGEYGSAVHADANGNIFVAGSVGSGADLGGGKLSCQGNTDGFVASYTSAGEYRWAQVVGSADVTQVRDIVADGAGNVFVTGGFEGDPDLGGASLSSAGGSDVFLASYASTGAFRWAKRFGGIATDTGNSVAVDGAGNVFVTGDFFFTVDFGGPTLTAAKGSSGDAYDIFVASYTTTGGNRWARRFGSTTQDHGYGIAVDSTGRVVVTGEFMLDVDFGGGPLTASGNDAFLLSLH